MQITELEKWIEEFKKEAKEIINDLDSLLVTDVQKATEEDAHRNTVLTLSIQGIQKLLGMDSFKIEKPQTRTECSKERTQDPFGSWNDPVEPRLNQKEGGVDENDENCLSLKSLEERLDRQSNWIKGVSMTVSKVRPKFQDEIDHILVKLENLDARVKETNGYYRDLTEFEKRLEKLETIKGVS